jgi:hypothetical protein
VCTRDVMVSDVAFSISLRAPTPSYSGRERGRVPAVDACVVDACADIVTRMFIVKRTTVYPIDSMQCWLTKFLHFLVLRRDCQNDGGDVVASHSVTSLRLCDMTVPLLLPMVEFVAPQHRADAIEHHHAQHHRHV